MNKIIAISLGIIFLTVTGLRADEDSDMIETVSRFMMLSFRDWNFAAAKKICLPDGQVLHEMESLEKEMADRPGKSRENLKQKMKAMRYFMAKKPVFIDGSKGVLVVSYEDEGTVRAVLFVLEKKGTEYLLKEGIGVGFSKILFDPPKP